MKIMSKHLVFFGHRIILKMKHANLQAMKHANLQAMPPLR